MPGRAGPGVPWSDGSPRQSDDGTRARWFPAVCSRIAPGHDGWVIADDPVVVVEFQGAAT
jgi:hypothetical protein